MVLLKLWVVGVTVELETMFGYNVAEQEDVQRMNRRGAMHQTLGDALI